MVTQRESQKDISPGRDYLGLLAALVAPLTWGLTGTFVRLLGDLDPMTIVVGRLLVGAVALAPVLIGRRKRIGWTSLPRPAMAMAAYYILATEAFARAPVVEVTMLIGAAPIIALGIERTRGRRVPPRQFLGVIIALAGLAGFLWPSRRQPDIKLAGDLLALVAATMSAAYAVGLREMARRGRAPDAFAVTVASCLTGVLAGSLLIAIGGLQAPVLRPSRDFGIVLLLGIVSTAVPTVAFSAASARLPVVFTTSLGLSTPLFAAVFAGWVLGEWPVASALPAALLAIIGLILVVSTKSPDAAGEHRPSQHELRGRSRTARYPR
jgi:DME family drug/metabolite transporter